MINPAGQVLFEAPLLGEGKAVAELWQDRNGEVYSCFVRGDKVIVYRDDKPQGSFKINIDSESIPRQMIETFQPL